MQEVFKTAFDISMIIFVMGTMMTVGLGLSISKLIKPFKNIKMLTLVLIANFIIVPLFAFLLIWALPVPEGVRIGIILLSMGGGAPFIPKIVEIAEASVCNGTGVMLLLTIVTILYMPIVVPLVFSDASVSSWEITRSLIFTMLIPLSIGLYIKALFSDIAARIQPFSIKITNLTVLILIICVIYLYTEVIIVHAHALPIVILFFLGATGIGYFIGRKSRDGRIILSVGTGLRNPPIAMLVASQHFSTEPMASITPLLVIIIGLSIFFPLAAKIGKNRES